MELWWILLLSFLAEIIEVGWQYADRFDRVLERIDALYRRSVFLLLLGHTGYLYLLYVSLRYDLLDWPIILAIALKTLDIFTKIELMRRLHGEGEWDPTLRQMMQMPIPLWLWLLGPLTYPWLIYLGFLYR